MIQSVRSRPVARPARRASGSCRRGPRCCRRLPRTRRSQAEPRCPSSFGPPRWLPKETEIDWTILRQGALAGRDQDLETTGRTGMKETDRVVRWLKMRIMEGAPQAMAERSD
jgi:hypothetical protein